MIANNASFFFCLSDILSAHVSRRPRLTFPRLPHNALPLLYAQTSAAQCQWIDAGQPMRATVLLIKGMHLANFWTLKPGNRELKLDQNCHLQSD